MTSGTQRSPQVGVVMGSTSDWEVMEHASKTLDQLGIAHDARAISAHRAPDLLFEWIASIELGGADVIIAAAGGAAALPGMVAAKTALPVLGVPIESKSLCGLDSLLSISQMPAGVPVGTLAIGKAGAINAALLAAAIIARRDAAVRDALLKYRAAQTAAIAAIGELRTTVRSTRER